MSSSVDELRQIAVLGGLDFAGHFAQLGFDVGELQLRIDFFLGFARHDSAALESRERVFVQRPAHFVRAAAQSDVVRLRAGEIQERRAEAFLFE